jgi:hypothetical protein
MLDSIDEGLVRSQSGFAANPDILNQPHFTEPIYVSFDSL